MVREIFLVLALASPLTALDQGDQPQPDPQRSSSNDEDLCNYLKDVEAKTAAACGQPAFAALKAQDPKTYSHKLELTAQRKTAVLRAYEFLRSQPAPGVAGRKDGAVGDDTTARRRAQAQDGGEDRGQASPLNLQPPINERTFPAWVGPEAKDLKQVYTRWLQAQNQELQAELKDTVSPESRKEIEAALSANQTKISALGRLTAAAELSCFLGESCGTRSELQDPTGVNGSTGNGAWTKADYARANETEAKRQIRSLGGKIDRGVPSLGDIGSEVVANTPMGPLAEKSGNQQSALGTVAAAALATTGALLLFGGLGGKLLKEKYPNIRRDMGIAAGVSGAIAVGAMAIPRIAPLVLSTPQLTERARNAVAAAESPQGQRLGVNVAQRLGSQPGAVQTLASAPSQASQELQSALTSGERFRSLLMPGGRLIGKTGSSADTRVVRGTGQDAERFFSELTKDAQVMAHPRGVSVGRMAQLPSGGHIGLRYTSTSGPPTIDVNVPGFRMKIKYLLP